MTPFIPSVTTMLQANTMDLARLLTLRQDLERFRLLVENAHDLIAEITLAGLFVYVSPNVRTVLGRSPGELVQQNIYDYVHPDDLSALSAPSALTKGLATCRFRHGNGSWRWLETSGSEFFTPAGGKHSVLIARDVTARKEAAEAQLRQEHKPGSIGIFAGGVAREFNKIHDSLPNHPESAALAEAVQGASTPKHPVD